MIHIFFKDSTERVVNPDFWRIIGGTILFFNISPSGALIRYFFLDPALVDHIDTDQPPVV